MELLYTESASKGPFSCPAEATEKLGPGKTMKQEDETFNANGRLQCSRPPFFWVDYFLLAVISNAHYTLAHQNCVQKRALSTSVGSNNSV